MRKEITALCILSFFLIPVLSAQKENYVIARAPFSSPRYDEFSPVFYREGIIFCSNRTQGVLQGYSTQDNKSFFKIYYSDTTRGSQWQDSRILAGQVNSNLNNGPATFSRKGDTIYFSRNLIVEGSSRDISDKGNKLGLFSAVLRNGEWTDIREMRFNDASWNVTTPFLSPDGTRLYFASDKPDGFGGSDLFYSEWKNGYWNNPVNLGNIVNTGGNEAYPFINDAGDLFFSSDSLPGKGGKDIFFTRFTDTAWITPVNLSAPVNSRGNDFGFISDGINSRGYFSSDRNGNLDIYSFRTVYPQFLYCEPEPADQFCFSFTDDAVIDIDPIALQFTWDFGDGKNAAGYIAQHCYPGPGAYRVKQLITDKKTGRTVLDKGLFDLRIDENLLPGIILDGPVSAGKEVKLSADINAAGNEVSSYFWEFSDDATGRGPAVSHVFGEGETTVKLLANIKEGSSGKTKQVCVEKTVRIETALKNQKNRSSSSGIVLNTAAGLRQKGISFETIRSVANDLESKAVFAVQVLQSPKQVSLNNEIFKKIVPGYIVREIVVDKGYAYVIDEQADFKNAYPSFREALQMGFMDSKIITFSPTDTGEIELWNFKRTYETSGDQLFVNNGSTISQKGMPVLDRLVMLMKRNPDLKIHVAAFTDASGSVYSSLQLTQKQAQNIADYLILNGINRTRLTAKGYGGSRPIAPEFPESERLRNRRIEFISVD